MKPRLHCFWQDLGPPGSGLIYRPPTTPAQLHWPAPCLHPAGCPAPEVPPHNAQVLGCCLCTCFSAKLALSSLSCLSSEVSSSQGPLTCSLPITGGVPSGVLPRPSLPCPPLTQASGACTTTSSLAHHPTTPYHNLSGTHSVFLPLRPLQIPPFLP